MHRVKLIVFPAFFLFPECVIFFLQLHTCCFSLLPYVFSYNIILAASEITDNYGKFQTTSVEIASGCALLLSDSPQYPWVRSYGDMDE